MYMASQVHTPNDTNHPASGLDCFGFIGSVIKWALLVWMGMDPRSYWIGLGWVGYSLSAVWVRISVDRVMG